MKNIKLILFLIISLFGSSILSAQSSRNLRRTKPILKKPTPVSKVSKDGIKRMSSTQMRSISNNVYGQKKVGMLTQDLKKMGFRKRSGDELIVQSKDGKTTVSLYGYQNPKTRKQAVIAAVQKNGRTTASFITVDKVRSRRGTQTNLSYYYVPAHRLKSRQVHSGFISALGAQFYKGSLKHALPKKEDSGASGAKEEPEPEEEPGQSTQSDEASKMANFMSCWGASLQDDCNNVCNDQTLINCALAGTAVGAMIGGLIGVTAGTAAAPGAGTAAGAVTGATAGVVVGGVTGFVTCLGFMCGNCLFGGFIGCAAHLF